MDDSLSAQRRCLVHARVLAGAFAADTPAVGLSGTAGHRFLRSLRLAVDDHHPWRAVDFGITGLLQASIILPSADNRVAARQELLLCDPGRDRGDVLFEYQGAFASGHHLLRRHQLSFGLCERGALAAWQ